MKAQGGPMKPRAAARARWAAQKAAREAQEAQWAAEKKAQQDWNAKPRSEQIADAQYVLQCNRILADAVMKGLMWMSEAVALCREAEAASEAKPPTGTPEDAALMLAVMEADDGDTSTELK